MGTDRKRVIAVEQAPFQKLVKLIEHELELAGQGRLQELHEAVSKTGDYIETLPNPAPASARQLVLRAEALRGRVTIEVTRLKESIALSRASLKTWPPRGPPISPAARRPVLDHGVTFSASPASGGRPVEAASMLKPTHDLADI